MNPFIPWTDSLLDNPELLRQGRLVPYHVDRPCFRWALGHATGERSGEGQNLTAVRGVVENGE